MKSHTHVCLTIDCEFCVKYLLRMQSKEFNEFLYKSITLTTVHIILCIVINRKTLRKKNISWNIDSIDAKKKKLFLHAILHLFFFQLLLFCSMREQKTDDWWRKLKTFCSVLFDAYRTHEHDVTQNAQICIKLTTTTTPTTTKNHVLLVCLDLSIKMSCKCWTIKIS